MLQYLAVNDRLNASSIALTFVGLASIGAALAAGSVRTGGAGFFLAGLGLFFNGLWQLATRHRRPIANLHPVIRLAIYGGPIPGVSDEVKRVAIIGFELFVAIAFMAGGVVAVVSW